MAQPRTTRPTRRHRRGMRPASLALVAAVAVAALADTRPAEAQRAPPLQFPARPRAKPPEQPKTDGMLVRADEMHYDQVNDRVAAVGNVQIYYNGSTLEADRVIYDQKTKRLHAEGNVRLSEQDGRVTHGEIIDLSDDYRDGFVDSLRIELPDDTRIAARRADRSAGNITVYQNGVYTACEPCADDPRKPPKWQIKATRIIHSQTDKKVYFEGASLEFFGYPV